MSVVLRIIEGPIDGSMAEDRRFLARAIGCGASVRFEGIVRELEESRRIRALRYELYRPMVDRVLERLAHEVIDRHGLLRIEVWHSEGLVPVGSSSFRLIVESGHRAVALAAVTEFIDRMKIDAPIWKHPEWDE